MNVGQQYCFDANYYTWNFDHYPYAMAWLGLSFASYIWIKIFMGMINKTPTIVEQEQKLRVEVARDGYDIDEITNGLSVEQVPQLRTIYDHADEMLRMPGQGNPGDGEVPLENIKRVFSTLIHFHLKNESSESKVYTHIFLF